MFYVMIIVNWHVNHRNIIDKSDIFSSLRSIPKFNIIKQERRLFPMKEAFTSEGRGVNFVSFKRRILPMLMRRGVYFPRNGGVCFLW